MNLGNRSEALRGEITNRSGGEIAGIAGAGGIAWGVRRPPRPPTPCRPPPPGGFRRRGAKNCGTRTPPSVEERARYAVRPEDSKLAGREGRLIRNRKPRGGKISGVLEMRALVGCQPREGYANARSLTQREKYVVLRVTFG